MQAIDPNKIRKIVFFIGYDWDVHNQVELYIAQAAKHSRFNLSTLAVFCNGKNKFLNDTCELLKDAKEVEKSTICDHCCHNKISKFSNIFDSTEYLFGEEILLKDQLEIYSSFETLDSIHKRNILSPALSIYRASSCKELREIIGDNAYEEVVIKYYSSYLNCSGYWEQICNKHGLKREDTIVIMFNGRFHPYSSILSVLRTQNIDCILHERGTLPTNWRIAKNTIPYDILSLMKWIDKNIQSIDLTNVEPQRYDMMKIREFMEKRFQKGQQNFPDFKGTTQLDSSINQLVQNSDRKVIYYTSSLDEICIFDQRFTYTEQLQYLQQLAVACKEQHFGLIVRQHPNLGQIGSPSEATYFLNKARMLQQKYGFIIIEPDIKCHWSILATNGSLNIVPYSSLYIDMMYYGYPCISLGSEAHLGKLAVNPQDWSQTIESLERTFISVQNILNNPIQKRRIKFFAYSFYLASCVKIPMASVANNYMPRIWDCIDSSSEDQVYQCHKFISSLLLMDDFPIKLHK